MDNVDEQLPASNAAPAQVSLREKSEEAFHLPEVVTIAAAHGAHDTYFSYLPTILPLLIKSLSLNTTQAGLLTACSQIPSLLQPAIGHLADHKNLKLLVILAPALSGIFLTLVGVAPSFGVAAALLLLAGLSTAAFHAIAPSMVGAESGRKVGRGLGFFMVGGEIGFGLGPVMVVAVVSYLTLKGLPWLASVGILASIILYFRLKQVSTVRHAQAEAGLPVREALLEMRWLMLPVLLASLSTAFLNAEIVTYLPTFLASEGVAFSRAGISLAVVELSGTVGVFLMGLFSDRVGQRNIAVIGTVGSAAFAMGFLLLNGWLQFVMLLGIGMCAFVANPAYLSMVQAHFVRNRSLANGVYMSSTFILRSIVVVIVGLLADRFGMRSVFMGSTWLALLAVPIIFTLPMR